MALLVCNLECLVLVRLALPYLDLLDHLDILVLVHLELVFLLLDHLDDLDLVVLG